VSRFWIPIVNQSPDAANEAQAALRTVGIGTVGLRVFGRGPSDARWRPSRRLTASVEAESAEAAIARVREIVGADRRVGPATQAGTD
jgi:hypothetical protein